MKDRCTTHTAKGTILSLLLTTCAAFTACTDKSEELVPQGTRALDVQVKVQPTSRAMVKGTALAEGAGLGVNVTATDGGLYDGKDAGYLNILYTATGTGVDQKWNSTTPVMLSGTEGKMYAYYPHTPGVDFKAISVDITAQHDWMYSAEAYTVSDKAATAAVVLKHAQTAVNVNVVRDATYTGVGSVSALSVTSEGLASGGTLDTRDGSWSALSGANTAISIISENFTLDGSTKSSQENPYMFIPAAGETKDFVVAATVDGKTYNSSVTMKEAFAKGKMYSVSLKMTNVGFTVSEVTLVDWDEVLLDDATLEPEDAPTIPVGPTINSAGKPNGVYIVTSTGELVDKSTHDGTALGVVLITDNQRILISKTDIKAQSWSQNLKDIDITALANKEDQTAAKVDFSGKDNTAKIITGYAIYSVEMDNRDMCKTLETFNASEESAGRKYDWYVPALGQLYEIYTLKANINAALANINGNAFDETDVYWSSSEYDATNAWYLNFIIGIVNKYNKNSVNRVRFVRDIE